MKIPVATNSRLKFTDLLFGDGVVFWDTVDLPEFLVQADDTQYVALARDRLDSLAWKFYGDSRLWWVLAIANDLELIPNDVYPGQTLRIPASRYVLQEYFKKFAVR